LKKPIVEGKNKAFSAHKQQTLKKKKKGKVKTALLQRSESQKDKFLYFATTSQAPP
jgi:hypothetical protein